LQTTPGTFQRIAWKFPVAAWIDPVGNWSDARLPDVERSFELELFLSDAMRFIPIS